MARIIVSEPDGPYNAELDTHAMTVVIKDAFNGVLFETANGEKLAVSMRDSGFELHYFGDDGERGFDAGWLDLKTGDINTPKRQPSKGKRRS